MTETSKKQQLLELIRANPFISQQELADQLHLSRSAVAGHISALIRERQLLGRAYVLPERRAIACIGAANLDRKLHTLDKLVPGTSNPARQGEAFGGVARNIAENLARMGADVALLTAVGNDASGRALLAHADGINIDTRATPRLDDAATGTYTAVLDHDGEMAVALADMAIYERLTPGFMAARRQQRANASLVVADLNLPVDTVAQLVHDAREDEVPLVIVAVSEPKMARLPQDLLGVRLLILNEGELAARVGRSLDGETALADACREVQAQGAQDVVVTRGARGVLFTAGGSVEHLAAHTVEVVDVTGAGDAFAAAICLTFARGSNDLALACRRGLRLAALTLGAPDTVSPALTPNTFPLQED